MKITANYRALVIAAVAASIAASITSQAAVVTLGTTEPELVDGQADGWSGITVLDTPLEGVGDQIQGTVVTYNYNTAFSREFAVEAGDYEVTPLLVKFDGAEYSIIGVGATHTPLIDLDADFPGFQEDVPFDVQDGTDTFVAIDPNESFHIGFLQQSLLGDNTEGGVVPFANGFGLGMFQMDTVGPDHAPIAGDIVTSGHASPDGGREYAINFEIDFITPSDADSDGMLDAWERLHGLVVGDNDAALDPDGEGLTNLQEHDGGTNPNKEDTDDDGFNDNVETGTGTWVSAENTGTSPTDPDGDGDGLLDGVENPDLPYDCGNAWAQPGTSPHKEDSDDGGQSDLDEIWAVTDPTVGTDDSPLVAFNAEQPDWDVDGGQVDGWSGISWLETPIPPTIGDEGNVAAWSYYAADGRATTIQEYAVTPILFKSDGFDTWIVGIGETHRPTSAGAQSNIPFNVQEGSDMFDLAAADAVFESYHIGFMQQRDGVDDVAGGVVSFANNGGTGMFQLNSAGPDYEPFVDDFVSPEGFASASGGRDYKISFSLNFGDDTPVDTDVDNDGLPNRWERANNLNPCDDGSVNIADGPAGDKDGDGVTNLKEFEQGTAANNPDSDGDGLSDGAETNTGVWVGVDNTGTDPLNVDTDGDGLEDGVENHALAHDPNNPTTQPGTDPNTVDTDGDGFDELFEIAAQTDPTDPNSAPRQYTFLRDPFDVDDGPADGWSAVCVFTTPIPGGGVGFIQSWNYMTDDTREFDILDFQDLSATPVLLESDGIDFWIVGIGATHRPTVPGPQRDLPFDLQSGVGTINNDNPDNHTFHVGVLQQRDLVDDDLAALIPYAGSGGSGMFQMNLAGPDIEIFVDDVMTADHASGPGGRNYSVNFIMDFSGAPPQQDSFAITGWARDAVTGAITITWPSEDGATYGVERSLDLSFWLDINDNIVATGASTDYEDTTAPADADQLYYRVRKF